MPVDAWTDARGVATQAAAKLRPAASAAGCRYPGDGRRRGGRVGGEEGPQLGHPGAVVAQHALVEPAEHVDLVEEGREEPHVGVGADLHGVAHAAVGRLDAPGVDEHQPCAAAGGAAHLAEHVWHGVEGRLRRPRVLADDQAQVRAGEVGDRVHQRGPEHGLAGHELVGAVLRAGGEAALHAERAQQGGGVQLAERVEGGGVADVGADGAGAVRVDDGLQAAGGGGQRVVPRRRGPRAVGGAQHRVVQPVRVVVQVHCRQALVAGEALGDGVVAIRRQLLQPAALHMGDQAAARLADPAERPHRVHPRSVAHRRAPEMAERGRRAGP